MPKAQAPLDEVVEDKGVRILIDPKAVMFLIGTEMDYKRDKLAARFIFTQSEPDRSLRLRRIRGHQARKALTPTTTARGLSARDKACRPASR